MLNCRVFVAFAIGVLACHASAQDVVRYKSAVVALTDDAQLRQSFERDLAAKARTHDYDAVASYDLVPNVGDVDNKGFVDTLVSHGVQAVLMIRPAAVGEGSSLDSVRKEVSPKTLADMRSFAKKVSGSSGDDLIAVVHMAIYLLRGGESELISSGAVWLDEPVETREEGIERLQNLMLANVDAARPQIRQYLRLPPLPEKSAK
jgi:hypothetical protein